MVKVGFCARTITSAAAPFAIATKKGWYAPAGIKVQLVPVAGSTDCVKLVATGDLPYSLPSIEPLPAAIQQGIKAKIFYTAYQGNIYGIAVPKDSPVRSIKDLKGKKIGVASMGSAGVHVARGLLAMNGLDPDTDAQLVVVGEAAQAAAMLRGGQVSALSLYDTQYALIDSAGQPVRLLPSGAGHDTMIMGALCPAGMLFMRCKGGVSHNPAESIASEDCEVGLAALMAFVRGFKA